VSSKDEESYGRSGDDQLDSGDVRRVIATALVVIGSMLLVLGGATLYLREEVFNADRFADRSTVALQDDDVRQVLADQIVDQIIAQGSSELIQAKPLLQAVVANVLGSSPFRAIFRRGVVQVHRALFDREKGSLVLDLADTGTVVISAAKAVAPGVAKKIPPDVETGLIQVSERSFATRSLAVAGEVRFLGIVLPLVSLLCFVLAFVVGHDRRRTAVNFGLGLATAGGVGVIAYLVGKSLVVGQFHEEEQRRAASAVWDAFMVDLRTWCLIVGGGGIVIAAASSTYLQTTDISDEAEAVAKRLLTRPKRRSLQLLRALGLALLSLWVVLEPTTAIQLVVIAVGAYGLYYAVGELLRLYQPASRRGAGGRGPDARAGLRGYTQRAALVGVGVVALAGLGVIVYSLATGGEKQPRVLRSNVPIRACNGYAKLCDRPLNEVSMVATHNSMSAAASPGWFFAGHRTDIGGQLRAGVRGLLIDTHYGVRNSKGVVRTDLDREGTTRAKVEADIGASGVAAAERLVGRLGGAVKGQGNLYLCHTLCELGATRFSAALKQVKQFLDEYPNEIVVIFVQDATTPKDTAKAFLDAGLGRYLYTHERDNGWPGLRTMIRTQKRLFVLAEEKTTGAPPWYHQGFDLVQETPYTFTSLASLEAPASCRANRGTANSPLFQLNHWIERVNPSPSLARKVNAYDLLLARAERCRRARGLIPNLVNVDFYDEGAAFQVVNVLNGLPRDAKPFYARR
jgi:hypothetical protein